MGGLWCRFFGEGGGGGGGESGASFLRVYLLGACLVG